MPVDMTSLRIYVDGIQDNRRWADFNPRPDDIFVCTPAKCGTTWMQTIIAALLWPDGHQPAPVADVSIWIDAKFSPADDMHRRLEAQTHRRFIKTHTPADGIPWYDDAKYIYVARDGRDAFMSMCNHQERMKTEVLAKLQGNRTGGDAGGKPFDGDIHRFFPVWLEHFGHIEHVRSYWALRSRPNLLLVHYNDLKADLEGGMRRVAAFLGIHVPETLFPACVERCTFERMREDPQRMGSFDLFEGGIKGFIFKGTNGRWKDVLTAAELAAYDAQVKALLSPDAAAWMASGSRKT